MANQSSTLWDEFLAAARGTWALLRGDRRASSWFDFSRRGLYGSIIGLIVATTINGLTPAPADAQGSLSLMLALIAVTVGYCVQAAFVVLVLKQMQRFDGFAPFLVAEGWTTAIVTLVAAVASLAGIPQITLVIGVGIVIIITRINIARLIVTLSPWQVAILFVVQLVGDLVGLLIVGLTIPVSPEMIEAAAAAASSG